jgi:predicted GIY-YIG superfamily endonuclease
MYTNGSNYNRSNWGHPQVAINVAQWISPEFSVKVSAWIYELMLTGKVELGKEKSSKELDKIYEKKRLSFNSIPYFEKDIVYIYEFQPTYEFIDKNLDLFDDKNKRCYEFGVTSNIEERELAHQNDKMKVKIRLDKCFKCVDKKYAFKIEKYIKKLVLDLELKLSYYNKKECFIATDDELKIVYDKVEEILNNNIVEEEDEEEEKFNIILPDMIKHIEKIKLEKLRITEKFFENNKLNSTEFERLFNNI